MYPLRNFLYSMGDVRLFTQGYFVPEKRFVLQNAVPDVTGNFYWGLNCHDFLHAVHWREIADTHLFRQNSDLSAENHHFFDSAARCRRFEC